ncbi:MAG: ABC transporter permease, partial [Acidobacteriota bacterium]|nr:ABC transporter permease [Acidobacteriota bacterium]
MNTLLQDIRYSLRNLSKSPVFTAVALVSLALGIGANTAIFTLMDQVLLRALPVKDPARLVLLDLPGPNMGMMTGHNVFSYPMYRDVRDANTVFSGLLGYFGFQGSVSYKGQTERVEGDLVTGNFFEVLGVRPYLGRTFTPEDDRAPGAHPVVVLNYNYWKRRFGGDPAILNQTIRVNNQPFTVVGVSEPGFRGLRVGASSELMVPMMMKAAMTPGWDDLENRRTMFVSVMGRLKPGMDRQRAEVGVNTVLHPLLEAEAAAVSFPENVRKRFLNKHLSLASGDKGRSQLREQFSAPLVVLMSMVGLVLLIACANVANLLLARAAARQKEIAIRLALGAGRRRIAGQLLVESVLLAILGGGLGLLVSAWTGSFLIRMLPFNGALQSFSSDPDPRVLLFALGLSLTTGILFGLAPAVQATRPDVSTTLKAQANNVSAGSAHVRIRKLLVVAQVALSLLLLIGAGLFGRSLYNLKNVYPGFEPLNLLTFAADPSSSGYSQPAIKSFYERLQERLGGLPGVESASMAEVPIMNSGSASMTVHVEGYRAKEGEDLNPSVNWVGTDYFRALGIPLVRGRVFTKGDIAKPSTAIINETMAHYFFGNDSPLGRRLGFGRAETPAEIEIVGVVKDSKSQTLNEKSSRYIYLPYPQDRNVTSMTYYVRTRQDPARMSAAVQSEVRKLDADLPVFDVKTMQAQLDESLFTDRIIAVLSSAFGLLATLLAAVGLYGVMAYTVARRTREIGVRIALGANRASVLRLVMGEVALMAVVGIAVALPVAYWLSRLVQNQLYGINANDPLVAIAATAGLGMVALLAGYLPALRATRVDPIHA